MNDDAELLRRYALEKSESAFAEFVRRHVDFVYGCALRRVGGDEHAADDVTQLVFVAAARHAAKLARHPVVTGWLFTASRSVAAQRVRTERRRQAREQEADLMEHHDERGAIDWEKLRPVLDDALDSLSEADRQAVLLRYFEGKSFAEIGRCVKLAENTARMRVDRALDKLSAALSRRGVTSSAAAIAAILAQPAGVTAPVGLAAAATGAALAGGAAAATSVTTAGAVFMGMTKLQLGLAGGIAAIGGAGFLLQSQELAALRRDAAVIGQHASGGGNVSAELIRLQQAEREALEARRRRDAQRQQLLQQLAVVSAQTRRELAAAADRDSRGPRTSTAAAALHDLKGLDVIPSPLAQFPPVYPRELRQLGVTGEALIDFIVEPDGTVSDAFVAKASDPRFGTVALAAVNRWRFEPGQKHGQKVAARMQVPVVFMLQKEDGNGVHWF